MSYNHYVTKTLLMLHSKIKCAATDKLYWFEICQTLVSGVQ